VKICICFHFESVTKESNGFKRKVISAFFKSKGTCDLHSDKYSLNSFSMRIA
jgi:hypothetical protein